MKKAIVPIIAASAAVAGCTTKSEFDGPSGSKNYTVGNFQQIEVAGPYQVTVHTGGQPGVSGSGPEKLLEHAIVEVQGDKLVIRAREHRRWFGFGWGHHNRASFVVTVPQLSAAEIAGSGDIRIDHVQGPAFEGSVAGSGGLEVSNTDVQTLKLSIGGSGGVTAKSGKAKSIEYSIAGSGGINAAGVAAEQAKVSIAGSGSVKANATGTAQVDIMGSGNVVVTGGAKCAVNKAGSGNVSCS